MQRKFLARLFILTVPVEDRVFRIGHLGDFNDLMLMGTLCGVEMGLMRAEVDFQKGGAQAAMDYLAGA